MIEWGCRTDVPVPPNMAHCPHLGPLCMRRLLRVWLVRIIVIAPAAPERSASLDYVEQARGTAAGEGESLGETTLAPPSLIIPTLPVSDSAPTHWPPQTHPERCLRTFALTVPATWNAFSQMATTCSLTSYMSLMKWYLPTLSKTSPSPKLSTLLSCLTFLPVLITWRPETHSLISQGPSSGERHWTNKQINT